MPVRPPAFVCWTEQGRNDALAGLLGADLWFFDTNLPRTSATAPLRWLAQSLRTAVRTLARRPSALIVMQPPVPLLAVAVALGAIRRVPVVADFHHAPFEEPKWQWSLGPSIRLARYCALSLVTNPAHLQILHDAGVEACIVHDPPEDPGDRRELLEPGEHVIVPVGYQPDEPIDALFAAARSRPDLRFALTGQAPAGFDLTNRPPNVELTGWLTDASYDELLGSAAAVLCLTTRPNTMQRGGYEALAWHRPLVTSASDVLEGYFGDAAIYCDPEDPESIGAALDRCRAEGAALAGRMAVLAERRAREFPKELEPVRAALSGRDRSVRG